MFIFTAKPSQAPQGNSGHTHKSAPMTSDEQAVSTTLGIIIKMWTRMILHQHYLNSTKTAPTGMWCVLCPSSVSRSLACKFLGHGRQFLGVYVAYGPCYNRRRQACILEIVYRGKEPGQREGGEEWRGRKKKGRRKKGRKERRGGGGRGREHLCLCPGHLQRSVAFFIIKDPSLSIKFQNTASAWPLSLEIKTAQLLREL